MHEPSAIRTISVSRIPLPVEYKLISSCDFAQKNRVYSVIIFKTCEIPQNALTYAIFRSKALSKVIHILECLYIFNIYHEGVCYEYTCNRLNCSCI